MTNGHPIIKTSAGPGTPTGVVLPMSTHNVVYEKWSRPRWLRTVRAWFGLPNPRPRFLYAGVLPGEALTITALAQTGAGKRLRVHYLCVGRHCTGWTINKLLVDGRHALFTPFVSKENENRISVSGVGESFTIFATNTTGRTEDLFASLLGDLVDVDAATEARP